MLKRTPVAALVDEYGTMNGLKPSTIAMYQRAVKAFGRWLNKPLQPEDFNGEQLSAYITSMTGKSDFYRRSQRGALVALQHYFGNQDAVARVRPAKLVVHTNTPADLRKMRDGCDILDRLRPDARFAKYRRSDYMRAYIQLAWETCLRPDDLHRLPRELCLTPNQQFTWSAAKTGEQVVLQLSHLCCVLVSKVVHPTLALPPIVGAESLRKWLRLICDYTNTEYHGRKGFRKAAGTAVEAAAPGTGHLATGNSRAIFEQHYLDRSQLPHSYKGPGAL